MLKRRTKSLEEEKEAALRKVEEEKAAKEAALEAERQHSSILMRLFSLQQQLKTMAQMKTLLRPLKMKLMI